MITYHYVFKNPIGSAWQFGVAWDTSLQSEYSDAYVSAITLHQSPNWGPGTVLNFMDGAWTRNGQPVEDYSSIRAAVFSASPTSVGLRNVVPDPIPTGTVDLKALVASGKVLGESFTETLPLQAAWPTLPDGRAGFMQVNGATITGGQLYVVGSSTVASALGDFLSAASDAGAIYVIQALAEQPGTVG